MVIGCKGSCVSIGAGTGAACGDVGGGGDDGGGWRDDGGEACGCSGCSCGDGCGDGSGGRSLR